jgi:hypothetical protein
MTAKAWGRLSALKRANPTATTSIVYSHEARALPPGKGVVLIP